MQACPKLLRQYPEWRHDLRATIRDVETMGRTFTLTDSARILGRLSGATPSRHLPPIRPVGVDYRARGGEEEGRAVNAS